MKRTTNKNTTDEYNDGIFFEGTKEPAEDKAKSMGRAVWSWVKVIVIALAIALAINFLIIVNSNVPSGSMEPTIMSHSRMIGSRLAYLFDEPERGDIIIFKCPDPAPVSPNSLKYKLFKITETHENYVKRIIGLPGETIEIKGGVTYIDGVEYDEPYLKETPIDADFGPYVVPEDCYFVMGDNRNNSKDSRYWTTTNFVTKKSILGKAQFVYWPIKYFGKLK